MRDTVYCISRNDLYTLSHLDKKNEYVGILFVDYSSAFNTVVPSKPDVKLQVLDLNIFLCCCILNLLSGIMPGGQNLLLADLQLWSLARLFTNPSRVATNAIVKFVDDTTVSMLDHQQQ